CGSGSGSGSGSGGGGGGGGGGVGWPEEFGADAPKWLSFQECLSVDAPSFWKRTEKNGTLSLSRLEECKNDAERAVEAETSSAPPVSGEPLLPP
ncbi:hypothetical protein EV182_008793, partial [Spiromyces aspiralis]